MKIKVKLHPILKKYTKGKTLEDDTIILHEDTTLQGLSRFLNIPDDIGIVFWLMILLKAKGTDYAKEKRSRFFHSSVAVEVTQLYCKRLPGNTKRILHRKRLGFGDWKTET